MAMNYWLFNNWYNNLNNSVNNIQGMLNKYENLVQNGRVQQSQNFSDVFQEQANSLNVPESMDDIFKEAAERYQVPEQLLKALAKAESNFDADAVSKSGAMGVMQLMPKTAESYGITDPLDARSNIMGGARCLSEKLQEFDGNVDLALAAYNAGSGNVRKYGGIPPFKETINHVRRVKEFMGMDLTTGKTVTRKQSADHAAFNNNTLVISNTSPQYSAEDAARFVELMRLQMQERMVAASQSILNFEDRIL